MEEKKSNVVPMNGEANEPTMEELKAQLMQARQAVMSIRQECQKQIDLLNYSNAFQQQQFMLEIVKMKDSFPDDIVEKAIHAISNFWFEESKHEEITDGQE